MRISPTTSLPPMRRGTRTSTSGSDGAAMAASARTVATMDEHYRPPGGFLAPRRASADPRARSGRERREDGGELVERGPGGGLEGQARFDRAGQFAADAGGGGRGAVELRVAGFELVLGVPRSRRSGVVRQGLVVVERRLPGRGLVEQRPESPNVRRGAELVAACLLGGEVRPGAEPGPVSAWWPGER